MIHRGRMLLVEDDESIQTFVGMALEQHPVDLLVAGTLARAREHLKQVCFDLVITDLTLPDGSGMDLLGMLHHDPVLRGGAELAVFSAGVDEPSRERLRLWGIHRVLTKPVPLAELERLVLEAIGPACRAAQHSGPPATMPKSDVGAADRADLANQMRAIDTYFGGDSALFHDFRLSCLSQFEHDVHQADVALASGDIAGLRRVAHSLKSVLLTLGYPRLAGVAKQVEADAAANRPEAASAWGGLRSALQQLSSKRD